MKRSLDSDAPSPPSTISKRQRTAITTLQPQPQPEQRSWTGLFNSVVSSFTAVMARPFTQPAALPGMERHPRGSLAMLERERSVIVIDDASEADPDDYPPRAQRQLKIQQRQEQALRHLNDHNVRIHPNLAKPLFESSFGNGSAAAPPVDAGPSRRPNVDFAATERKRDWARPHSPTSSRSSASSTPPRNRRNPTNLRTPRGDMQQLDMLVKLEAAAEREGKEDNVKVLRRVQDEWLRAHETKPIQKVSKVSSKQLEEAAAAAFKSLRLDTRKEFDDVLAPAPKKFEPQRVTVRQRVTKDLELGKSELFAKLKLEDEEKEKRDRARLAAKKPKVPTRLSAEQEDLASEYLADPSFKATAGNAEVDSRSLRKLVGIDWLNDDVLNFYMEMINMRAKADDRKVAAMNTFFFQKLSEQGYKESKLSRWTKRMKLDIFSLDQFLIPINIGNMHWVCAVVNFAEKRIEYYDSMQDTNHRHKVFKHLRGYLEAEHKEKKGSPYDLDGWTDYYSSKTPRQNNGSDCGVFAAQTLEAVARGRDLPASGFVFSGDNMALFRKLMVIEIAAGKLSKRTWEQ